MPEAVDTSNPTPPSNGDIRVVKPTDMDYLQNLYGRLAGIEGFWEDRMRINPQATFISIFANPANFVVDIGGDGVLAFVRTGPIPRCLLFGASWGPKAAHCPDLRRTAGAAALEALNAQTIEGITREDNTRARKAMEEAGMQLRGRIRGSLWYNGVEHDGVWYDIDRSSLDLDPL